MVHRQTDRKTDRQKQTDYNNPLLSLSVNNNNNNVLVSYNIKS